MTNKKRFLVLIPLTLTAILTVCWFLGSCASIPPLKTKLYQNTVKSDYLHEFSPRWSNVSAGVDVVSGKISRPKIKFYAVRVNLSQNQIILTPPKPENPPPKGKVYSIKVSSFATINNCLAAINAGPFFPVSARENEERTPVGLFVADGAVISVQNPAYDALVFYGDKEAAIVKQAAIKDVSGIKNGAGGFSIVLKDGLINEKVLQNKQRHPRSAAGLGAGADGSQILYLLVADGRWLDSQGATETETGLLLRALGARDGINLDGGGSSAMALRIDGKVHIINRPIHNQIPGKERAVASCIGVKAR
ncbi:MAG: phosphodiester glycosidase family protein [Spirochaetaceae bacterium]|jgi:hypothetical protein|nr:phosphodiester glycosidase family protein [Spirochaetaceae bacterium]